MKFNDLQKYILKVYSVVIIFFTFFVPSVKEGMTNYGNVFIYNSVGKIDWAYMVLVYIGITLATAALIFAFNDLKKKK